MFQIEFEYCEFKVISANPFALGTGGIILVLDARVEPRPR
jgi:hypothetical protein